MYKDVMSIVKMILFSPISRRLGNQVTFQSLLLSLEPGGGGGYYGPYRYVPL